MKSAWIGRVRLGLYLFGAGLLVYTIHRLGWQEILAIGSQGLSFLPLIALCTTSFYFLEGLGQKSMLGVDGKKVPGSTFVRTTLAAYAGSILLPLGRAGAEALRSAMYAPHVGGARALAASALFQAPALFSTGIHGLLCYVVVGASFGFESTIAWILLAHSVGSVLLAFVIFAVARRATLGRRLARWYPRLAESAEVFDAATKLPSSFFARAVGYCLLARVAEIIQYGVTLEALDLHPSLSQSIIAGAIHLVGATLGEAIPGQLGAVEGAFAYFAGALGLEGDRARAVTISLLIRVAQYTVAAGALVVSWLLSSQSVRVSREPG